MPIEDDDTRPTVRNPLLDDPILAGVPSVNGFKELEPYRLIRKLGEGTFGVVYLGRHKYLDIDVAVKVLKNDGAPRTPEEIERFRREARVPAQCENENLVRVRDLLRFGDLHCIVMEFIDGVDLRERLRAVGRLPWGEASRILLGAARGLAPLHKLAAVHRDLKPANIMLTPAGVVKVADFGLVRVRRPGDLTLTKTNVFMGSPSYASPEQFGCARKVEPTSDVWSLGVIFFELLTGIRPFDGDNDFFEVFRNIDGGQYVDPRVHVPEIPESIAAILDRCLQKESGKRFADAGDLATAIAPIVDRLLKTFAWATPMQGTEYSPEGLPCEVVHQKTGIEMVLIPAGTFLMGSGTAELAVAKSLYGLLKKPEQKFESLVVGEQQHEVRLSRPFYLARHQISNVVFKKWRPSHSSKEYQGLTLDTDHQPVVYVSWDDAQKYCDENDLRLPFEAEWEFAARGRVDGKSEVFPWGDRAEDGAAFSNIADKTLKRQFGLDFNAAFDDGIAVTAPVASKTPNGFGLHHMVGNVFEWCADWYDPAFYATDAARSDPCGPLSSPQGGHVLRGGSWGNTPFRCRSASREGCIPSLADYDIGFRPARDP